MWAWMRKVCIKVKQLFLWYGSGNLSLENLVTPSAGKGPSVTKLVYFRLVSYLTWGLLGMIFCFCYVYVRHREANPTFAAAIGALTVALVGFATNSHNKSKTLNATFSAGGTHDDDTGKG